MRAVVVTIVDVEGVTIVDADVYVVLAALDELLFEFEVFNTNETEKGAREYGSASPITSTNHAGDAERE